MKGQATERWPAAIETTRVEFAAWRAQKRGRERIPEVLWRAASRAARRYGVHAVSRALALNYGELKRRVEQNAAMGDGGEVDEAGFVELVGAKAEGEPSCVIELEKGNGTRMRICVGDAGAVDWCRVKEAFLGG